MATAFETYVNTNLPLAVSDPNSPVALNFIRYPNPVVGRTVQQRTPSQVLSDIGAAASTHGHGVGDISGLGALAVLNTVSTAYIDAKAVTLAKMDDFANEYSLLVNNTGSTGAPTNVNSSSLSQATPVPSDLLFGWNAAGVLKLFDVGDLSHGTMILWVPDPTTSENIPILFCNTVIDIVGAWGVTNVASTDVTVDLVKRDWTSPFSGGTSIITSGPFKPDNTGETHTTFTQVVGSTTPQVIAVTTSAKTGSPTVLFLAIKYKMRRS